MHPDWAPVPAPMPGDTWTYRRIDLYTKLEINRWSTRFLGAEQSWLKFRNVVPNQPSQGGPVFRMTLDLGHCQRSIDIADAKCGSVYTFPLRLGGKSGYQKLPNDGEYGYHSLDCVVAAREAVTVTAGTFDTYRVECEGAWVSTGGEGGYLYEGQLRQTYWYAPAVNNEVKHEIRVFKNKGGLDSQVGGELVTFGPGGTNPLSPSEAPSQDIGDERSPDADTISGHWYGVVQLSSSVRAGVEVVFDGTSGFYRLVAATENARSNPCFNHPFPLKVTSQTQTEVSFDVIEEGVVGPCKDQSVTLRRIGSRRLSGTKADGLLIRLGR